MGIARTDAPRPTSHHNSEGFTCELALIRFSFFIRDRSLRSGSRERAGNRSRKRISPAYKLSAQIRDVASSPRLAGDTARASSPLLPASPGKGSYHRLLSRRDVQELHVVFSESKMKFPSLFLALSFLLRLLPSLARCCKFIFRST